ncbi:coiled-coil domain-containing protein 178 isoform X2 [Harpia harpyja]|uniref:coiled-coil domain-containing protein 178 isoform X2 n=1 Tax=Harpia harpyja TaxID=202280 RepID=UPI0022B0F067|nr:coiled-coil domain-containing protein 178 isoform X2 [Harpia harpyja]
MSHPKYGYVFKEEKIPWVTKHVSPESIEDTWLSLSTKLDFKEADVSCEDGKTLTLKQETEALLLEVTELIKRLEADREEAEKALELEKQQRKKLGMKIDCMSLWRLQQLPAAVQKEYETCVQDTLELQWHFDCKSHQLRQVQNQILKIETVNRKIQEDIDFMKKHSPLVEEKLNLEGEAVKDALLAYEKTSKIYSDVRCELMEIQRTIKRIDEESEKKIQSMYEKIEYAEMLSSQYKNKLKHSEFIWTEYCMKLKETEEKIIKDEKHLEELVEQKAEIQEDAKCWNSKIEDLNNKIAAQGDESVKISDAYSEVIKAVEELKSTKESDLQNIKQKILNINEALDSLKCENEELEGENEEFLQKFGNSSRKKKAYQSEVETICKSMCKIEQQIERLNEDLCNAELSYSEKKRKYEDLKKTKTAEEISYKNSEWNLKKEIQDQKGVWKATQAALEQIMKENLWLAQEYQIFQNYYLNSKEDLTELYDNRIRVEAAIRDHQQLRALQRRLRGALVARWSRRGLSIQAGLARIQAASQENAQKILAVQGELSKAIQHITAFLRSLTDGSPTTDNNANNQCILDAETKDKKSHTVQITV